jgi:hypothetical protein
MILLTDIAYAYNQYDLLMLHTVAHTSITCSYTTHLLHTVAYTSVALYYIYITYIVLHIHLLHTLTQTIYYNCSMCVLRYVRCVIVTCVTLTVCCIHYILQSVATVTSPSPILQRVAAGPRMISLDHYFRSFPLLYLHLLHI